METDGFNGATRRVVDAAKALFEDADREEMRQEGEPAVCPECGGRNTLAYDTDDALVRECHDCGIEYRAQHTQKYWDEHYATAPCCTCGEPCLLSTAHLHQGQWIGDECCWEERLRSSE